MPLHRKPLKPCQCRWQKDAAGKYGYDVKRWTGAPHYWQHVGKADDVVKALTMVQANEHALIRCNGCGEDLLREYPANWKTAL